MDSLSSTKEVKMHNREKTVSSTSGAEKTSCKRMKLENFF